MPAPATDIINTAYFDSLIARIDAATSTADLQARVNEAFEPIAIQMGWIRYEIESLLPLVALVQNPPSADLTKIVSWITDFIKAQLAPQMQAYENYALQITSLTAKAAELEAAVDLVRDRLNNPPITIPKI